MSRYFKFFPKVEYTLENNPVGYETVTNILARYAFDSAFTENTSTFYKYDVKDGETPETIAYKFYDSSERHWIILMFNNIVDPQFDWPMSYSVLNEYIDRKYSAPEYADTANTSVSGLEWAKNENNAKVYYKTIFQINSDNTTSTEKIEIDSNTYANLVQTQTTYVVNAQTNQIQIIQNGVVTLNIDSTTASSLDICKQQNITKQRQSYYDYEVELNEKKRTIKLLKNEFIYPVEEEFKFKVNNGII